MPYEDEIGAKLNIDSLLSTVTVIIDFNSFNVWMSWKETESSKVRPRHCLTLHVSSVLYSFQYIFFGFLLVSNSNQCWLRNIGEVFKHLES